MRAKVRAILIVAGIFVVGYALMRWGTTSASYSDIKSFERRRMPCGRILERTVEEKNGVWTKTVRILDPSGNELNSNTASVESDVCDKIRAGIFVPGLWGARGTLGCE